MCKGSLPSAFQKRTDASLRINNGTHSYVYRDSADACIANMFQRPENILGTSHSRYEINKPNTASVHETTSPQNSKIPHHHLLFYVNDLVHILRSAFLSHSLMHTINSH